MSKFYTLSNDLVFKNVFLNDYKRIKWLLDGIFNMNIEIYNISNCELYKDRLYIRSKTVDYIIDTNFAYINMELNDTFNDNKKMRNFYYHISYLHQLVHVKEDYVNIDKPVIQINLNVSQSDTLKIINKYSINESMSYDEYLKIFYIININIAKYIDKWYNLNKDKEYYEKYKHFLLLGMTKEDLLELEDDDKMVKKIKNEIFNLNDPSEFPRLFSDEEFLEIEKNTSYYNGIEHGMEKGEAIGIEKGEAIGIEKGEAIGIEKTNIENARKMKEENIPINIIKKITGLDTKTIITLSQK